MRKLKSFFLLIAATAVIFAGCDFINPPPYQLSTSIVPSTGGTISPSTGPFKGGSKVTLVASPARYYKFVGWAGDASGNTNPLTINMNSDKQIVAQFEKLKYSVQIKSNPSDGGAVRPDSGQYEAGNKINITAPLTLQSVKSSCRYLARG